ncbi:uncharacterized protein STEHIDRAFT_166817 [Stereum hirsutum FP-91666 SS1]|uniref:uncharacterized protein n=1 Tax=Stereum hirsutum (strain FP-91666) TaxID=721885 RepID=UPI000440DFD1|nr:uncharacterized protein STEHIDRAFT_166817 [Stereum hirsutum FP-91666 SS1]EIM88835.1 hypothetical protein STEHIDRAFT_166817 [Stereum hirsutum FP-91666 SS1]
MAMFRSLVALTVLLALTTQVHAHAGVSPALSVSGDLTRNDVQRPSSSSPCGNINIAKSVDSSTPVKAATNGSFAATVTNFNGGKDGSREMTVQIDADGTGKNFVKGTMLVNGNGNPSSTGSENLFIQMPSDTQCTGGTSKDLCLASFTSTAGFGNCVVVQQDTSGSAATSPSASESTSAPSISTIAKSSTTTSKAKATTSASVSDTATASSSAAATAANAAASNSPASVSVVTDTVTATVTVSSNPTSTAAPHTQVTTTVFVVAPASTSTSASAVTSSVLASTAFTLTLKESTPTASAQARSLADADAKREEQGYRRHARDFRGRVSAAGAAKEVRAEMFERMWSSHRRASAQA